MVILKKYIPKAGDLVWINLNPTKGHEQQGRRPALVISHTEYNKYSNLVLVCPVTSKTKSFQFEVPFMGKSVSGYILSDQVRCIDRAAREFEFIERIQNIKILEDVIEKIKALISL